MTKIANTTKKKYRDSLKKTGSPISLSETLYACDIPGLFRYAKSKGKNASDLTDEEKNQFLKPRNA